MVDESKSSAETFASALEEYKLLVSVSSHIFSEFWQGNAFLLSFFTLVTLALLANVSTVQKLPFIIWLLLMLGLFTIASLWIISNIQHFRYTELHIKHASELERTRLGFSMYTRRLQLASEKPYLSARRAWWLAPVPFLLLDLVIMVLAIWPAD